MGSALSCMRSVLRILLFFSSSLLLPFSSLVVSISTHASSRACCNHTARPVVHSAMLWLVAGGACGVSPNWGTHSVTTAEISDGAVTSVKIARHAVGQEQIAPGAVTKNAIAFGAIGASQLGTNSVGPGQLQPHSVIDVNLADGVVVRRKIGRGAVGSEQIAPAAVKSAQLASGAVLTAHLAPGSVQPAAMSALFLGLLAAVAGLSIVATLISSLALYVAPQPAQRARVRVRVGAWAWVRVGPRPLCGAAACSEEEGSPHHPSSPHHAGLGGAL